MSETGSKKNSTMIALAVVLVVAVILSVVLLNQRNSLSAQVDTLSEELKESREAWETTAAEKEEVETELKTAQNALREAETALEESTVKIGELEGELAEANRVRTEAQASLDTISEQIDALSETLDYARAVLAGATEEPVVTPEPQADGEEPGEPEGEDDPAAVADASEEGEERGDADATAEEENQEVNPLSADVKSGALGVEPVTGVTPTDLTGDEETAAPEIPEDAVALEVVLEDETVLTLYVQLEDDVITFIYAEDIDEAFLEQFVGKNLPVVLLSDEEPEGIEPIEDDEATTLAVIDAVNSLLADEAAADEEPAEEPAA